ncbi:MAG TPA: ABC transporter ATP-binding protein [Acidimicrobiales bacterium]|nr:ABC transporter ATP-binding protein [Acidimicrobiales bacterium]
MNGRPADLAPVDLPAGPGARRGPALQLEGLRVWYGTAEGRLVAVDGIDLTVGRGETVGLVGESGCGKSTLGRAVLRLLPEGAGSEGAVVVGGRDVMALAPEEVRRLRGEDVSLIFQEPMTRLDPLMRVRDHFVELIRAHRPKTTRREAHRMTAEVLAAMGIPPHRSTQYPHQFSGGMRQRIMIALGIVLRPRLVVADEPTTALDVLVEAQILEILRDLAAADDIAVLLITHNLGIVAEVCDRVAVMYAGKIVEVGPVEEVFRRPRHPYTQGLLASVIHLGSTTLSSVAGAPPDLARPPSGCRFHPRCPHAMQVCPAREPPRVVAAGAGGTEVACWLHGPDELVPAGGHEALDGAGAGG